jgi:cytochrome c oxidase cbb3-type subunit 3/ubiquinol-cytochrome c reductase cytochrome c subunit
MIRSRLFPAALLFVVATALTGCDADKFDLGVLDNWMPGKPKPADQWQPASAITDGATLYAQNCLGCHAIAPHTGPALAMDNPLYLAVIPREALTNVITNGVPGKQMPAFIESKGGGLTAKQIDNLVTYILGNKKPIDGPLPPYSAPLGNPAAGEAVFTTYFASFPGMTGPGSITDPAFLGLVSDQYLRSLVIAGRSELGFPDYRSRVAGKAMTDQEIADVTAWIASHRTNEFGQPLTPPNP